ncbi:hypothetical protein F7725_011269 [Dissostichus mawsoni]|uniref:C-type lectin domain-containing protein n=1 Tax=Dissostichus mawsoni TaxID=36200 RepID=A0A7J5ZCI6_DISMA|nr:hypothetical protein F7725_011269 [Dissostichus mawsoni]
MKTWYEARDYCMALGGTCSLQFQHWEDGEPNNRNNVESCTEIKMYNTWNWNDVHCEMYHDWLCQIRADYNRTSDGWLEWNGNQYYTNENTMAMEEARHFCQKRHSDLVTINNEAESVFLWKQRLTTSQRHCSTNSSSKRRLSKNWKHFDLKGGDTTHFLHEMGLQSNKCYSIINTRKETFNGAETQCRAMGGQLASILSRKAQDPSLPDSPEPMPTDYVKILNDSMKVVTQNMSWDAAKQHCERDGAKLASLRNEWSQAYVELMALKLNASLWIGMNKNQTAGYFRFIDGWRITFTKWGRGEPSSFRSCVIVDVNGNWITTDCNQNLNSICMKSTDVPPTESSDFPGFCPDDPETQMYTRQRNSWLQFRGFCYLFLTGRIQWPDASAGCVRHGGTLASITDPSEQEFIHSNIISFQDQSSFWIGLYKTHRGMWQWLDRSVVDYSNWRMDQPGDHTYGAIRVGDGRWITGNQWYDRGYICKTAKVTPGMDPQTRGHVFLIVSLVIIAIVIGTLIALFLFKKSGRSLLIPTKLSTFDNPLFFNNERSKPDVVEIAE